MPSARRASKQQSSPHEARLLRLAAWILDQPEPASRARIYEAFPDDYRGKAEARERKAKAATTLAAMLGIRSGLAQ